MIKVKRGEWRRVREKRHAMHDSPDAGLSIRVRDGPDGYTKSFIGGMKSSRRDADVRTPLCQVDA